ncbi:MAG: CBS domain-containing protein [Arenicellales bacterium]
MISVESIMTPDPIRLTPEDTLGTAHALMNDKHIHHIPVVETDGSLVGLISHRDVLAARSSTLNSTSGTHKDTPLADIMTTNVVSIMANTGILKAAQYIHNSRHGCLPIVDDGQLIGIITEYDFVEVAINLLERSDAKPFEDGNDEADLDETYDADTLGVDTSDASDWD